MSETSTAALLHTESWGGKAALPSVREAPSQSWALPQPQAPQPNRCSPNYALCCTSPGMRNTHKSGQKQSLEMPARADVAVRLLSSLWQLCRALSIEHHQQGCEPALREGCATAARCGFASEPRVSKTREYHSTPHPWWGQERVCSC